MIVIELTGKEHLSTDTKLSSKLTHNFLTIFTSLSTFHPQLWMKCPQICKYYVNYGMNTHTL
ncbi:hypothetical protein D3C73_726260 [compost metagenome]